MTENRTFHGVDVYVTRDVPSVRGSTIHIRCGDRDGLSRMVRNMGHENVDEDIAHEVRVWLIGMARGRPVPTKGWARTFASQVHA